MTRADGAVENFRNGHSCCQAVLTAFADDFGLDEEMAMAIARGFGGGMGHTGGVCGVVSGGVMVIGLATSGAEDNLQAKKEAYAMVKDFFGRFYELNESFHCNDLLGYDISDPGDYRIIKAENLYLRICTHLIREGIEILEDILQV